MLLPLLNVKKIKKYFLKIVLRVFQAIKGGLFGD